MNHYDRVRDLTATVGTGIYTLSNATPSGYNSFLGYVDDGATVTYCVVDGNSFEVASGVYTETGLTVSRDSIITSSNSGNPVDWSNGNKNIFLTPNSQSFPLVLPSDPTATTNPAFNGKQFINALTGETFVCLDNTVDNNVWASPNADIVSFSVALG